MRAKKNSCVSNLGDLEKEVTALREKTRFLEDILESSTRISIVATDIDGNIQFWNRGAENIFGYRAEDVVGKENIAILYPDNQTIEEIRRLKNSVLRSKQGNTCKIREKTKDGKEIWVHLSMTPRFDSEGNVIGMLGVGDDITEQVKTEKALISSQQQLYQSQKMEALGTLVAGAAHEINNPVNLITLNMSLLKKIWNDLLPALKELSLTSPDRKYGGLTYEFLEEHLGQILSDMDMAADRIAKIVSDLKNFARQSSIVDREEVQVNVAVRNAVRLARTTLKDSGVDLELDLDESLPVIEGNLQGIEQVILNMIINAIQAIHHDRGRIKISSRFRRSEGIIEVDIWDNGSGISPELADRIFDPFVTDKQDSGGTGLGLSVSYSIVKAHDGDISFETDSEAGTTFTISIPTKAKKEKIKVLIVDDDSTIRDILTEALTEAGGYQVTQASNGAEANIKLGTYRPDLLVLDLSMPKMDGLEVCRAIKNEPELANMKVLITTGFLGDARLDEIARLGFTKVCPKPFTITRFLEWVEESLAS